MAVETYRFGDSFQARLLATYIRDHQRVASIIGPQYFSNETYTDIARMTKECYARPGMQDAVLMKTTLRAYVKHQLGHKRRDVWTHYNLNPAHSDH
jgi:hypothetical protein